MPKEHELASFIDYGPLDNAPDRVLVKNAAALARTLHLVLKGFEQDQETRDAAGVASDEAIIDHLAAAVTEYTRHIAERVAMFDDFGARHRTPPRSVARRKEAS